VIDTATRALRGLDENNAKDMGMFSAACEFVQRELDCTVLVIRHTGKDAARGGRGSNVLDGDFDTILDVERHEKTMHVALTVKEQRNAAEREIPYTFVMTPKGQSLFAAPVSPSIHAGAIRQEDGFSSKLAGAALARLGAIGEDRAVATWVLATEMTPAVQSETEGERESIVRRAEKALRARSRGSLAGYTTGDGPALRWFLAPGESSGDCAPQAAVDSGDL